MRPRPTMKHVIKIEVEVKVNKKTIFHFSFYSQYNIFPIFLSSAYDYGPCSIEKSNYSSITI